MAPLLCRDDMTREEAIAIVAKAIRSGIFNDLGSGSNVDLCVISEGGKKVDYLRNYEKLQDRTYARQQPVVFQKGTARESMAAAAAYLAVAVCLMHAALHVADTQGVSLSRSEVNTCASVLRSQQAC